MVRNPYCQIATIPRALRWTTVTLQTTRALGNVTCRLFGSRLSLVPEIHLIFLTTRRCHGSVQERLLCCVPQETSWCNGSNLDSLSQTVVWKRWHGSFPLSINSLEKASCLLELGSYKSFKNYLFRIKEIHTEAGYMWTQALQNAAPRCTRSVLRGLGGPSKSEAFDLDGVVRHLLCNDIAVTEDGPDHRWQQWS